MAVIDINWNPPQKDLRWFAALQVLFFGFVGYLVYRRTGSVNLVATMVSISAIVGVIGCIKPSLIHPIYVVWMAAVFPISWVVSHVILAVIFYGVFTPFGLLMRLAGRDPMQRKLDRSSSTYWIPRKERGDRSHYFRQF